MVLQKWLAQPPKCVPYLGRNDPPRREAAAAAAEKAKAVTACTIVIDITDVAGTAASEMVVSTEVAASAFINAEATAPSPT